jgi:hypothetical protein
MAFRRFVHLQYGENRVANLNCKIPYNTLIKSPDIGLKYPEHFSNEFPNLLFRRKIPLVGNPGMNKCLVPVRPGDFSLYENYLKTIV